MKNRFKYLSPFFFLCISALFCYFAFKEVKYEDLKLLLKPIPKGWILLSMLFGYLAYIFRGLRWVLLIEPLGYKPKKSILIHAISFGYLFNAVIPRSGELIRCTALNKVTSIPISKLFGHVILERLIDVVLLLFCVLIAFFLNYQEFLNFFQKIQEKSSMDIYAYIPLVILIFIFLYIFRHLFLNASHLEKITSFFAGIKIGFISIKEIQNKFLFFLYTILIWVCYFLMTVVCFYCFSETKNLNLGHGVFILIAGAFGMIIPSQAGLGSYHWCVKTALLALPFSIPDTVAIGFAHVVWCSQMFMIVITGLIGWRVFHQHAQNKNDE